ncbi:MAG TPA: hypothetical protein PKY64_07675 [Anaerolineaceae bacterium]|nr:hypothetical protein [Anaerolineaceae bacterium]
MESESFLFVGGEFYYDDQWNTELPSFPSEGTIFLNGGKACLTVICDYLRDHGIHRVLLPAYLCPTIVDTIESSGLSFDYYDISPTFTIDTNDLEHHLREKQAVYFINYFGFSPNPNILNYLSELKHAGRIVIEDNAQAGFLTHVTGDFAFNSMRKLCPFDGGYLKTSHDLEPYLAAYTGRENRRLPLIRQYRSQLKDYLFEDIGDRESLEALFTLAESNYATDGVVLGDEQERQQIEHLDWSAIKWVRRQNYTNLLSLISGNQLISPIFPALQPDNMPLGLPVYVRDGLRDQLNEYLGENGIGLTIHWEDLLTDPRLNGNALAVEMTRNILTLAIDQYTNQRQLEYLAQKLADFAETVNLC